MIANCAAIGLYLLQLFWFYYIMEVAVKTIILGDDVNSKQTGTSKKIEDKTTSSKKDK